MVRIRDVRRAKNQGFPWIAKMSAGLKFLVEGKDNGMKTESYWRVTQGLPEFSKLERDLEVDVVVVGGGLTGITAAYLLRKEGVRVALIDPGRLEQRRR